MIQCVLMSFSTERVNEFTAAWEEAFGETLTEGEASYQLARLITLYRAILKPLPPDDDGELGDIRDVATAATPPPAPPAAPPAA